MNECLFMGAEHEFLFLPSKCDIFLYLSHSLPRTQTQGTWGPGGLPQGPWSLLPDLVFFSLLLLTVSAAGRVGLECGCTSQLMLRDRRRENKNCLALVSSKVIYFQKLTESHCRGFIYFYSECHYSVMQGTWAHVGADSHKLECGRRLLMCRLAPGRVRGSFSGAWQCLGTCMNAWANAPVSG